MLRAQDATASAIVDARSRCTPGRARPHAIAHGAGPPGSGRGGGQNASRQRPWQRAQCLAPAGVDGGCRGPPPTPASCPRAPARHDERPPRDERASAPARGLSPPLPRSRAVSHSGGRYLNLRRPPPPRRARPGTPARGTAAGQGFGLRQGRAGSQGATIQQPR